MRDLIRRILREEIIFEMGKQLTQDDVILKLKQIFGDTYDLSKVDYKNTQTPIKLICPIHGDFSQNPNKLFNGKGCQKCSIENRGKLKNERWLENLIERFKEIHGDQYDYSNSDIKNSKDKIEILCKKHGIFKQTPGNHLNGHGCPSCAKEQIASNFRKDVSNVISAAKQVHGDFYDYSLVDYKNGSTKVTIICPIHGNFEVTPKNHINNASGCPDCWEDKRKQPKSNTLKFIEKSKKIHGNTYDYSNVDYLGVKIPVNIICTKHGDFFQTPNDHLNGGGCPKCSESKGERFVAKLLERNNILFIQEKKFKECFNIKVGKNNKKYCTMLPFDFYLPNQNICIEYDGEQHFKPIEKFGGQENLKNVQNRDKIKTEFCEKQGITLIRIPYTLNFKKIPEFINQYIPLSIE
jgi:hypothetical protein